MADSGIAHEDWARAALSAAGFMSVDALEVLAGKRPERAVVGAIADGRPVVVKRLSAERRARGLPPWRALWVSSFGATREPPGLPELLAEVDDLDAVVSERVPGGLLGGRRELDETRARIVDVAALLRDLHTSGVVPPVAHDTADAIASLRVAVNDRAPDADRSALHELIDRLDDHRPQAAPGAPVHGDFNPRNIFVTPTGLRLIDMDLLQHADPALDLGHWSAWCWIAGFQAGRASWQLGDALLRAYAALEGGDVVVRRVTFHEVARLLRIGLGSSVAGRNPEAIADLLAAAHARLDQAASLGR